MRVLILAFAVLALLASGVSGLTFDLPARKHRCFVEEFTANSEIDFTYAAAPGYAQFIDVKVNDHLNNVIWSQNGKDRGHWKALVEQGGEFAFCFYSRLVAGTRYRADMQRSVSFQLGRDHAPEDYAALAAKEKLKPLEINLRIMEDVVRAVHSDYVYFKDREMAMRDTSEHMFSRAMWLSIVVMGLIVAFALWQVRHIKLYFKKKRIID